MNRRRVRVNAPEMATHGLEGEVVATFDEAGERACYVLLDGDEVPLRFGSQVLIWLDDEGGV